MDIPDTLQFRVNSNNQTTGFPKFKNVLIYVLESTPAEYVETYGGRYAVTPTLSKFASSSVTFENFYAHAPATNLSMVSMLCSMYPWLSYNSLTQEHPDMLFPSLSQVLKTKGYRTSFFNSADNRYQKAGEFLSNRQFDLIRDYNNNTCQNENFEVKNEDWDYMSGKDDHCSGKELTSWINEDPSKPFFSVMWTYQTHYPYFFRGPQKTYEASDSVFNRYLNALHYGDSVLGMVIDELKNKNIFDSTLIVVVGDHGEAFGRHDQITHGRKIYEENLHVPCILINPLIKAERKKEIGGMVDLAPSILSLLRYDAPSVWQGENLFSKKNGSVYFFAPWSDYLFGYRQGNFKYIYNATLNETEIYDVVSDPTENHNLAGEKMDEIPYHHLRMAAWAQYVNRSTAKIIGK